MAEIKAVKDPQPDPKIGRPKPKSGVSIPYFDLAQSEVVAKTIHEQGGGACSREQLAPLLKYSGTNNGGFLTRVSAAKMFGLIEESGDTLRSTQRAMTILAPIMPNDAERARIEAFLGVDFFRTFYEKFKGTTLPQEAGLKNLLENTYSVVPGRVVPSLRVLMDSAEQAGFFKTTGNRSKMVMPILGNAQGAVEAQNNTKNDGNSEQSSVDQLRRKSGGGGGNDGTDDPKIPAALLGLLKELPQIGTVLQPKRRAALVGAFKSAIDFLYPEPEDSREV
jgi:hypothetical protein